MFRRGARIWQHYQADGIEAVLRRIGARLRGYRDLSWGVLHPPGDPSWIERHRYPREHDNRLTCHHHPTDIIIVSYNGLEYLRECIASILAFTTCPDYRILIVDNASQSSVRDYLHTLVAAEKRIQVIYNTSNLGFAAANNIGIQHTVDSEFVVMLNNDTVVSPGWLCRLVEHANRPQVGMAGPVTNWTGNEAKIPVTYRSVQDMPIFAKTYTQAHSGQVFDISVLAMFCVALRRTIIEQVGLLDERFGVGLFEDEDYARRIRQAGLRIVCAKDVFVHHYGMASFGSLPSTRYYELFNLNRRLFEEKWGETWTPHSVQG